MVAPGIEAWAPWPPSVLAARLAGVDAPWCVAAGWALDLFLGRQTRPHEDVEICVPAHRFGDVRARFPDCDFFVVADGELHPLPARVDPAPATHQTWALERSTGRWRFDVFREPAEGDVWLCRRDPGIRRPYAEVVQRTASGIPYLAPEVALLFKANGARPKDEADLAVVLPALDEQRQVWLASALARVHPGHPWLDRVRDPTRED